MMTDSATREEEQKKRIIRATLESIASSGLDNVTLQSIAVTAGLSKGGLTYYYSSKKELFLAAFTDLFDKIVAECKTRSDSCDTPLNKLLSFEIIFKTKHPMLKLAHPVLHSFMSVVSHDPLYQGIYHEWVETWVELIREILEEGVADSSFSCSDIDFTARTISAIIQGIATRCFLAPKTHSTQWAVSAYRDSTMKILGITSS